LLEYIYIAGYDKKMECHELTIPNFMKKSRSTKSGAPILNFNVEFFYSCWLGLDRLYITVFTTKQLSSDSVLHIIIRDRQGTRFWQDNENELLWNRNVSRVTAEFIWLPNVMIHEDMSLHIEVCIYDSGAEEKYLSDTFWQLWNSRESWLYLVPEEVLIDCWNYFFQIK
jgi:hypothetical protein